MASSRYADFARGETTAVERAHAAGWGASAWSKRDYTHTSIKDALKRKKSSLLLEEAKDDEIKGDEKAKGDAKSEGTKAKGDEKSEDTKNIKGDEKAKGDEQREDTKEIKGGENAKGDEESEGVFEVDGAQMTKGEFIICLLYTSPSPRDRSLSRMPSSA